MCCNYLQNMFMWCAFDGPPNIVRLFGKGRTVLPGDPEWAELRPLFADGYINICQITDQ